MMKIPNAPIEYPKDLESLWAPFANSLYVNPAVLKQFHTQLVQYLSGPSPEYRIRKVGQLVRGALEVNRKGHRLIGTDNSPAWWVHAQLTAMDALDPSTFHQLLRDMPSHMFGLGAVTHANKAGWYFAHVERAKDGNTNWLDFDAYELTWRMVRSLHPLNFFFVPKAWGRHLGEDPRVIAFFREKLRDRYADVVEDFDRLSNSATSKHSIDLEYMPTSPTDSRLTGVTSSSTSPRSQPRPFSQPLMDGEPLVLLRINKMFREGMSAQALYEATRGVWRMGIQRGRVRIACAVSEGVIREVFTVDHWQEAGSSRYETRSMADTDLAGRWEFSGSVAPEPIRSKYLNTSVHHYFPQGAANPVRYLNC